VLLVLVTTTPTPVRLPRQLCLTWPVRRWQRHRLRHPTHQLLRVPFQISLRNTCTVNLIQPVRQSIPTLRNLQLHRRNNFVVVRRVQVACLEGSHAIGHDDGADEGVCVGGPGRSGGHGVCDVGFGDPGASEGLVGAGVDGGDEGLGPGLGVGKGVAADFLLRDVGVPVGVKVVVGVAVLRELVAVVMGGFGNAGRTNVTLMSLPPVSRASSWSG
jgi:hypothetical protein